MSLYHLARYCTAPDVIKFACKNGISENPMYLKCADCPNNISCEIYFDRTPAPELSPEESEMIDRDLENARKTNPRKLTRSNYFWMAFWAVLLFLAWLKG